MSISRRTLTATSLPRLTHATNRKADVAKLVVAALGPDDAKVEFVQVKTQTAPIQSRVAVRVIRSGGRDTEFHAVDHARVGTQRRAMDHIGFEVKNLEAFTKKLKTDGIKREIAYRKVPALDIAIAFIKDPGGRRSS